MKTYFKKIFEKDLSSILKTSRINIIGVSIFIGFLLFLLNMFLGISLYAHQFTGELRDKLGMYFYIKDDVANQTSDTYKRIINMKSDLESHGLKVMFSSKEDALAFLEKKVPDVVSNFQKFGIENPLPATLYVMFANDNQYNALKTVILKNKDIILNTQDIDAGSTLKQQENRVLTVINLSNFIIGISYVIIITLLAIILSFIGFLLKAIFHTFHRELEIKKILGANHRQIIEGFIALTIGVLILSFIVCFVLLLISGVTINYYIYQLFSISLGTLLSNTLTVILIILGELIVIIGAALGFSYMFANKLNKKL